MVLFCNSPNEVDGLLSDLKWKPIEESLRRLEHLKLNKEIKLGKKLNYCNYSFEEAQLLIAKI